METNKQQIETIKANSFSGRYARTGSDFKIYFDTLEELKKGIDAVIEGKDYLERKLNVMVDFKTDKDTEEYLKKVDIGELED